MEKWSIKWAYTNKNNVTFKDENVIKQKPLTNHWESGESINTVIYIILQISKEIHTYMYVRYVYETRWTTKHTSIKQNYLSFVSRSNDSFNDKNIYPVSIHFEIKSIKKKDLALNNSIRLTCH